MIVVDNYNYQVNMKEIVVNVLLNDYEMDDKLMIPIHYLFHELWVHQLKKNEMDH